MGIQTFIIKCDGDVVAERVHTYDLGMIVEALAEKYYKSAEEGELCITVQTMKMNNKTVRQDDEDDEFLPF